MGEGLVVTWSQLIFIEDRSWSLNTRNNSVSSSGNNTYFFCAEGLQRVSSVKETITTGKGRGKEEEDRETISLDWINPC